MADADSNGVKMTDEASGEQAGVASTERDTECEMVSDTTESGDPLRNVGVTADDKMECEASAVEKRVKPEEASISTTNSSDVAEDKMECEEIRDEPKSINTSAEIREESKTAEAGAETLAHSETKDEMECEDAADKLKSENSKSLLKESQLPTDEEKLAETSNNVSVKVDALKLTDQEKGGMECVSDKFHSENATARNSSESKSVHVDESAPNDESSNDGLITGKKTASVDLSEFLGKNYDIHKLPLPYSPSSGELADESTQSSLSSNSSERTRMEEARPVTHLEIIVEDPKSAGASFSTASTASSVCSSDTREPTSQTTEAPKMKPLTLTSGSELISAKNESQKFNDLVTELPKTGTTTNAVASSSAPILPEDRKPKEFTSDDTIIDDTISGTIEKEILHVELVIMKEAEVAEGTERAKPVHLSPKKPQTLQTEKDAKELFAEEEKFSTSDAPGFQPEHSNVELPMKQDESVAATPEDVQSGIQEPRSQVKRRINVDEENCSSPSKKANKKQEDCT